jgi:hypothetical protein
MTVVRWSWELCPSGLVQDTQFTEDGMPMIRGVVNAMEGSWTEDDMRLGMTEDAVVPMPPEITRAFPWAFARHHTPVLEFA